MDFCSGQPFYFPSTAIADMHRFTDLKMKLQEKIVGDVKEAGVQLPGM